MKRNKQIKIDIVRWHNENYKAAQLAAIQENKIKEGIKRIVNDHNGK